MKPFITDACKDGRCSLPFQFEGIKRAQVEGMLLGRKIVAYALPAGHSLGCAWQFRFMLGDNYALEFSSACTVVADWQEVGSLNMKYFARCNADEGPAIFQEFAIGGRIAAVERLIYEDSHVYSECGLVFHENSGMEVIVATGISPGSVSISAPFSKERFEPEFPVADYRRTSL